SGSGTVSLLAKLYHYRKSHLLDSFGSVDAGARLASNRANGLDAIRDSRIAFYQVSFGTHPRHTRHRKSAGEELSARLRAWREKNDFSQSEAALRLQISKLT